MFSEILYQIGLGSFEYVLKNKSVEQIYDYIEFHQPASLTKDAMDALAVAINDGVDVLRHMHRNACYHNPDLVNKYASNKNYFVKKAAVEGNITLVVQLLEKTDAVNNLEKVQSTELLNNILSCKKPEFKAGLLVAVLKYQKIATHFNAQWLEQFAKDNAKDTVEVILAAIPSLGTQLTITDIIGRVAKEAMEGGDFVKLDRLISTTQAIDNLTKDEKAVTNYLEKILPKPKHFAQVSLRLTNLTKKEDPTKVETNAHVKDFDEKKSKKHWYINELNQPKGISSRDNFPRFKKTRMD